MAATAVPSTTPSPTQGPATEFPTPSETSGQCRPIVGYQTVDADANRVHRFEHTFIFRTVVVQVSLSKQVTACFNYYAVRLPSDGVDTAALRFSMQNQTIPENSYVRRGGWILMSRTPSRYMQNAYSKPTRPTRHIPVISIGGICVEQL